MVDEATKAGVPSASAGPGNAAVPTAPRPRPSPSNPPPGSLEPEALVPSAALAPPKPSSSSTPVAAPSSGVVMTPMRIIEVKGGGQGPPPPLPGAEEPITERRVAVAPEGAPREEVPPEQPPPGNGSAAESAVTAIEALSDPEIPQPDPSSQADAPTPPETPVLRREVLTARGEPPAPSQPSTQPGQSTLRLSGPPPPPAIVDLDSPPLATGEQLESISEDELTEVKDEPVPAVPPRKKRRSLPPRPPPRASFSDGEERKRAWWEDMFGEDFPRANYELTPSQLERELNFIDSSLGLQPSGTLLDLACGDGAISVGLARRGYNVSGIDISVDQLARARELAIQSEQKVEFKQADMREPLPENAYDALICWNASFGYFEEEKNVAILKNVFRALKPGGAFLLDVPNRDFVIEQQPNQNWFEGDGCVCMDDMHVDFITSRLCVKRTVMLDDGRNREWSYSMRIYGLHELGSVLHNLGFRVTQVSGQVSTPGVFFGSKAPQIIALATKPL